jgi:DNA-binding NarL/FixJ family response regulator
MKSSKQIFIVEDNEIFSMMLDYILSKDSIYDFVNFKSGEECLANMHMKPDIVILDYGLPGISGYETLLGIKKVCPDTHVIILSSNKDRALAAKLLSVGADDYILKQGHGETQLINRIETILAEKKAEAPLLPMSGLSVERWVVFILIVVTVGFFISRVV